MEQRRKPSNPKPYQKHEERLKFKADNHFIILWSPIWPLKTITLVVTPTTTGRCFDRFQSPLWPSPTTTLIMIGHYFDHRSIHRWSPIWPPSSTTFPIENHHSYQRWSPLNPSLISNMTTIMRTTLPTFNHHFECDHHSNDHFEHLRPPLRVLSITTPCTSNKQCCYHLTVGNHHSDHPDHHYDHCRSQLWPLLITSRTVVCQLLPYSTTIVKITTKLKLI